MKYLLLLFFPFLMKGQVTGVRTAYTFTNGVYHYGFVGASQNSEPFYAGFSYYGGITPRAGVSLVNKYQIQAGYSIPIRKEATFNGFTLTIVINLYGKMLPW